MRIEHLRLFFPFLLCFFTLHLTAQESLERAYPAGEHAMAGIDIQQTSDGGYLTLSFLTGSVIDSISVVVSKLSPKGDVDWAKRYRSDEVFSVNKLILLENDTFAILSSEGLPLPTQTITKAAPNGDIVWSKSLGTNNVLTDQFQTLVSIEETNSIGLFSALFENGERNLIISFLDAFGNLESSTVYKDDATSMFVTDAKRTEDNGFVVAGNLDVTENEAFLFKIDSLRNSAWSQSYQPDVPTESIRFSSILSTPDSGYLAVGLKYFLTDTLGVMLKLDSMGIPQWGTSLQVDSLGFTNTKLTNIISSDDGNMVVSGIGTNALLEEPFLFMFKMNPIGDIQWIKKYSQQNTNRRTGLTTTQDGGYAYFGTTVSETSSLNAPYLAKVDADGVSSCEDTLSFFTDTLIVQMDTLVFETESFTTIDSATTDARNFNDYSVPILSLMAPPPFCEDEPIEWTFDANTPGAVSYLWNTGETTDTLAVTEEGMYIVDVRIETDVCYNLCDTAMISVMGPPMVDIVNTGNFCQNGTTILAANPSAAVDSYLWNTGETTQAIEVTALDTYSVTVTNRCGSGEGSIAVIPEDPTVDIIIVENLLCQGGNAILTAESPGATFVWSDGSTADTLVVSAEGTYTVNATNSCGTSQASADVLETGIPLNVEITIEECNDGNGNVILTANIDNAENLNFLWSDGSVIQTIAVTEPNIYSVTVTDNECGTDQDDINISNLTLDVQITIDQNTLCNGGNATLSANIDNAENFNFAWSTNDDTQTITVSDQGIYDVIVTDNECGRGQDTIELSCCEPQIPNVFTPNGDTTNDSFGVVLDEDCEDLVTIRVMRIYNRWGQLVFESATEEEWNGEYEGKLAPSDVYVYYVELENTTLPEGKQIEMMSGDVTLVR